MTRDHFAKEMQRPNFAQSYEKTPGAKFEKDVEKFFNKIVQKVRNWKK